MVMSRVGILAGSLAAALAGFAWLWKSLPPADRP